MKRGLLLLMAAAALVAAGSAIAGGKSVQTTLSGRCTAVDKLDHNGALLSTTIACTASAVCRCGGSTKLVYKTLASQPGNGGDGRESGSFVASGASGSVTLLFKGMRSALGEGKGTWTLGKVTGLTGVKLAKRGTYSVTTKTTSSVIGTKDTLVRVTATLSPWVSGT